MDSEKSLEIRKNTAAPLQEKVSVVDSFSKITAKLLNDQITILHGVIDSSILNLRDGKAFDSDVRQAFSSIDLYIFHPSRFHGVKLSSNIMAYVQ